MRDFGRAGGMLGGSGRMRKGDLKNIAHVFQVAFRAWGSLPVSSSAAAVWFSPLHGRGWRLADTKPGLSRDRAVCPGLVHTIKPSLIWAKSSL